MESPEKSPLDRLLLPLFLLGLCALCFVGGAWTMHAQLPGFETVSNAFEGAGAWLEKRETENNALGDQSIDDAVAHNSARFDPQRASDGYTLITARYSSTAYLLDMQGHVVHRWDMPFSKAWPHPSRMRPIADSLIYMENASLLPSGDLVVVYEAWGDTPYGYGLVKIDKDSHVVWTYDARMHHDVYIDQENGNIYGLSQQWQYAPLSGLEKMAYPLLADYVEIVSPEGKKIDSISILDAFLGTPYEEMLYHVPTSLLRWDPLHTNTVMKLEPGMAAAFPMFKPGQILISLRNLNALAVIDPATRKVVWAYNGLWRGQHAAHFLPDGHILLLDNLGYAAGGRGHFSRVLEFDPATLGIAWHYDGNPQQPLFSYAYGRVQRLPNGDTLIADTLNSRVIEVTPGGDTVWDYQLPALYRKLIAGLPPYGNQFKQQAHETKNPAMTEILNTDPNLATAIVGAVRYAPEALPFLKEKKQ